MATKKKLDKFVEEKVINESFTSIIGERFGRYSKYIIQERALPDIRDGLKPVQRRILYAMHKLGISSSKPYKKSARIAGDVMGKFHPHGDSSIYESMVRMSQYWKMNVKLVDMHGNNGSIDGDPAAAMRYTETRLSKEAEYLLQDIEKNTVDFVPNFDDEELEPTVLPAKFPNILVNGATGISAGYATNIPPHNLNEVINAVIKLIDKPKSSVSDLMEFIQGPDFPTGGIVQGLDGIKKAYETGNGKIIIRSKCQIVDRKKDHKSIIVSEIPFEINKSTLVKKIDEIRLAKKIEGISEVRDESDRDGLQIAIDLKKDVDATFVLNYLYKNTNLQVSYNFNMVAIDNKRPITVGLKQILSSYINHQKDVITNRCNFELAKAKKRLHIVDGLIKMVDVIDEVIKTIRESDNKADSRENLMKKFKFSELQAEAIVTLQLYKLSNTDINELIKEQTELNKLIDKLTEILNKESKLLKVIKDELKEISKKNTIERKSSIEEEIEQIVIEKVDLIPEEECFVAISKDGYIKRSSIRSYKASSKLAGVKESDSIIYQEKASTLDTLLVFTSLGNYLYIPIYKIEEHSFNKPGVFINSVVPIAPNEKIVGIYNAKDFKKDNIILLYSKNGLIKQTSIKDFVVSRYSRPIRAMKLPDGDKMVGIDIKGIKEKLNVTVITTLGRAISYPSDEISCVGTSAGGVKSINLKPEDSVAKTLYTTQKDELVITVSNGNVKRIKTEFITLFKRTKSPKVLLNISNNSEITTSFKLQKIDNLLISCEKTHLILNANDIKDEIMSHDHLIEVSETGKPLYISNYIEYEV